MKSDFYDYNHYIDKVRWSRDPDKRVAVTSNKSCWEELKKI